MIDLEDVVKYLLLSKANCVFQDEVELLLFFIYPAVTGPGVFWKMQPSAMQVTSKLE